MSVLDLFGCYVAGQLHVALEALVVFGTAAVVAVARGEI